MGSEVEQQTATKRDGRSPGYPFFSVEKAITRAHELYTAEGSHWAPISSAAGAWSYSTKSSGGRQTMATMKYYGLIEVMGDGDGRKVRLTEIAKRILLDEREDKTEKRALIREVAMSPSAHRALHEEYKTGLPSDGTVLHFLMFTKGFNREAARDLLGEFKQTASYISLYEPQNGVDKSPEEEDDNPTLPTPVKVGDRIQATVGGQDLFPNGATVLGFTDDGLYAFTDQAKGGVMLEEITVLEAAPAPLERERPIIPASLLMEAEKKQPANTRKAVFPVREGDVSLIFPTNMTARGLRELGLYLQIFLKNEEEVAGERTPS